LRISAVFISNRYFQLSIDTAKEIIEFENSNTCTVKDLPKKCPDSEPRYHLFRFKHTHEGDFTKSTGKFILLF
jgi:twinfilin-like protein